MNNKYLFIVVVWIGLIIGGCKDPMPGPAVVLPKLSINNVTQFEGDENNDFEFKVILSEASEEQVIVNYSTIDNTASSGTDFVQNDGSLGFSPGELEKIILIEIIADTLKEETEEFTILLANPGGATLSNAEGVGTIRNDDDFVFIPEDGYITPESYGGFTVAWKDEFNAAEIDQSCWTHELGGGGWGNEELQKYTADSENSYIANGNLIIEARKNENTGEYTSARMITLGKKEVQFGRVDIRAKLPFGQGIWPAFWMLGKNITSDGWPYCGEIDIMEMVGHEPNTTHGTAHWGPQGQSWSFNDGKPYELANGEIFADSYHVFSIVWDFNTINWYVDDNLFFSANNSTTGGQYYPFNAEFFTIFNIAVGGRWPGDPDQTTIFPQRMIVDYIRVFQKE